MSAIWDHRRVTLRQRFAPGVAAIASDGDDEGGAPVFSVDVRELRRMLELPPLPHDALLGPACWMGGGQILRWLRDELSAPGGDCDLYFPTPAALSATMERMLGEGFRFKGFSAWKERICYRCGERVAGSPRLGWLRAVKFNICPRCQARPHRTIPRFDEIVTIDRALIERCHLVAVELLSPADQLMQLISGHMYPTPAAMVMDVDLTICQLAIDHQRLYHSAAALSDLAGERFGVAHVNYPPLTLLRIAKYRRRGFRPRQGVWSDLLATWRQARRARA
jgi:hypothetical protein